MSAARSILVVDDDPSALITTRAQLHAENFELRMCAGGADAMAQLAQAPADLVICDLRMPRIDGLAVCRAIKASPTWRYTPVILLTASNEQDTIVAGLEAGADEFVTKPVEGAVLRARVRSLLRLRDMYREQRGSVDRDALVRQANLTGREREVLELLLLGRTHEDISTVLGISDRTSKFHQANLLAKLGAESRLDLMRLFL